MHIRLGSPNLFVALVLNHKWPECIHLNIHSFPRLAVRIGRRRLEAFRVAMLRGGIFGTMTPGNLMNDVQEASDE